MKKTDRAQVVVVGSGAGGSVTALELAQAGVDVLVLEEGNRFPSEQYGASFPAALPNLFRDRGMNPILGRVPIGYIEGRCLGGSTEINSGFWQRTPPETLARWSRAYGLIDVNEQDLAPHFDWAEKHLGVSLFPHEWPTSTRILARGLDALGWSYHEVPRTASQCQNRNLCPSGCPVGAKRSMTRSLIPLAEQAGARFQTGCRVKRFEFKGARITAVLFERTTPEGAVEPGRVEAGHVFLCAGPTQTPWLLLRNGIKKNVGRSLQIHPMVKVIARFEERIDAESSVMPLIQVSEFRPDITLGGSYFSTGQLAMLLGENWPGRRHLMDHCDRMGAYYAVVKGKSKGRVRPSLLDPDKARVSYGLHREDHRNLKFGLSKLCQLLLAAGAVEVFPAIHGLGPLRTREEAERLGNQAWPAMDLPITTVHAFAACPAGERDDYCAADSFGRVRGLDNLHLGDASMIPESPSVNPQAGIMALAHRNVLRFLAERL